MPDTTPQPSSPSAFRRYLVVTMIATPANLAVISLLLAATALRPLTCNLLAATIVTVPSFVACSRWVWDVDDMRPRRALSFWTSSLVNVSASSSALWVLQSHDVSGSVLAITPLVVYATLWFARFAVLDRIVFRPSASRSTEEESVDHHGSSLSAL